MIDTGLSSLGVPRVQWHPQILADQSTLSQPRGADCAHQKMLAPPDFQTVRRPSDYAIHMYYKTKQKDTSLLTKRLMKNSRFSSTCHSAEQY